jgi:ketosteroid isomerase-like protein
VTSQHPVDIALRFVEQINRQNLPGLVSLMTDDHTFIDSSGDVQCGREMMRQGWAGYFDLCPDYMIYVAEIYLAGDNVILVGRTTGSHLQQPRHEEIRETIIWIATVTAEQVAQWQIVADTPENRAAWGAVPANRMTV